MGTVLLNANNGGTHPHYHVRTIVSLSTTYTTPRVRPENRRRGSAVVCRSLGTHNLLWPLCVLGAADRTHMHAIDDGNLPSLFFICAVPVPPCTSFSTSLPCPAPAAALPSTPTHTYYDRQRVVRTPPMSGAHGFPFLSFPFRVALSSGRGSVRPGQRAPNDGRGEYYVRIGPSVRPSVQARTAAMDWD